MAKQYTEHTEIKNGSKPPNDRLTIDLHLSSLISTNRKDRLGRHRIDGSVSISVNKWFTHPRGSTLRAHPYYNPSNSCFLSKIFMLEYLQATKAGFFTEGSKGEREPSARLIAFASFATFCGDILNSIFHRFYSSEPNSFGCGYAALGHPWFQLREEL